MMWFEKYIGIPFSQLNCAELVELVLYEEFNLDFKFPQSNGNPFSEARMLRKGVKTYCGSKPTENPKDGDLVLMNGKTRLCHVGLFVSFQGQDFVLHSLKSSNSVCLHRIGKLSVFGLTLKGIYKWQR